MVVLKSDKEKHEQEFHSQYMCEWCGDSVEKRLIVEHKKNDCPQRTVSCKYCSLSMIYRKLFLHQESCGAVTELCTKCNLRYPRSILSSHESTCNGTPVPPPPVSDYAPSINFSQTFNNYGRYPSYKPATYNPPNQDIMICEKCQQALNSYEELQIHVLTEHFDNDEMTIVPESENKNTVESPAPAETIPKPAGNNDQPPEQQSTQDNVTMTDASRPAKRPNEDTQYEELTHTNT